MVTENATHKTTAGRLNRTPVTVLKTFQAGADPTDSSSLLPTWRVIFLCSVLCGCGAFPKIVVLTDPLSGAENFQLGLLREKEGEFASAVAAYRAAISQGIPAYGELGNAHFQSGNFYAAERAYRLSLRLAPDNGPILNNLAQVYLKRRIRLDEAELLVRHALLLDRRDPATPYTSHYLDTLATLLTSRENLTEARDGW